MILETMGEIKAYYAGKRDGVRLYAWWKDGLQYVGNTGKSLSAALAELHHQEASAYIALSDRKAIEV